MVLCLYQFTGRIDHTLTLLVINTVFIRVHRDMYPDIVGWKGAYRDVHG
jgi:hypothetical protein